MRLSLFLHFSPSNECNSNALHPTVFLNLDTLEFFATPTSRLPSLQSRPLRHAAAQSRQRQGEIFHNHHNRRPRRTTSLHPRRRASPSRSPPPPPETDPPPASPPPPPPPESDSSPPLPIDPPPPLPQSAHSHPIRDDAAKRAHSAAPDCVSARALRCKTSRIRERGWLGLELLTVFSASSPHARPSCDASSLAPLVSSLLLSFFIPSLPFPSNPTPTGYAGAAAIWRAHAAFPPRSFRRAVFRLRESADTVGRARATAQDRPHTRPRSRNRRRGGRGGSVSNRAQPRPRTDSHAPGVLAAAARSGAAYSPHADPLPLGLAADCEASPSPARLRRVRSRGAQAARLRLARPTSLRRQLGASNSQGPRSREREHELRLRENAPDVSGLVAAPHVPTRVHARVRSQTGVESACTLPYARFVDVGIHISRAAR
ncbi:hypothetical protein C8J57DRAFT_1491693 [Mycena rebaudengoi]|nr:hypothetical protein C8J57DRAFT_1491693 [Mycena rebaudengoi]